jgi:hypothetical protein
MTERRNPFAQLAIVLAFALPVGCGTTDTYFEPAMDFGSLQSVAVLPFQDLTRTQEAAERVRDTFIGMLLATEAVYVLPTGTTSANVVSLSLQMMEASTGRVVWSASSSKGGITIWDRLLGTRGQPMNVVTEKVVNDLLNKLFE